MRMLGKQAEAREKYLEAVQLARARLEVTPLDANARALLALWCARAGDAESALREGTRAAEMQSENADVLFRNAAIRCILGRDEDALDWLEKATKFGLRKAEIENDPDLSRLRSHPRYRRIIELAS